MKTKSLIRLLAVVTLSCFLNPIVWAQTFQQFIANSKTLSTGACGVLGYTFICDRISKDEKSYLVLYDDESKPIMILREEDNRVVWKAGIEA